MQSFKNVEEFYSDNSARRRSPEADYGVHWKLEGWPNSWRVSYVRDTGEIYAVQQEATRTGILPTGEIIIANGLEEEPVLLLGHFPHRRGSRAPAMSTTEVWNITWKAGQRDAFSQTDWSG